MAKKAIFFISPVQKGEKVLIIQSFLTFVHTFVVLNMEIMLLYTLKTLGICISLLSWVMLNLACFSLIWHCKESNKARMKLLVPILVILWSVATYDTWYKDFYLLQEMSFGELFCHLLIASLSGVAFCRSLYYKTIKQKISSFFFLAHISVPNDENNVKVENNKVENNKEKVEQIKSATNSCKLSDEAKERVHDVLASDDFLFKSDASIEMLANLAFVNNTYLSAYFNRELRMSFPEYMKIHRLYAAEKYLKETDMQIADISMLIGFKNTSTFCNVFHERNGVTPLQWRKEKKALSEE